MLQRRVERLLEIKVNKQMASMMLGDQFFVGKIASVDNPTQRVTEDVRVGAVVESPLQFLKVAVHVLAAHLVECADDGSLEQDPHSLDPVCVNVADDPLLGGVAHRLMAGVVVVDPDVRFQFFSVDGLGLQRLRTVIAANESSLPSGRRAESNPPIRPHVVRKTYQDPGRHGHAPADLI